MQMFFNIVGSAHDWRLQYSFGHHHHGSGGHFDKGNLHRGWNICNIIISCKSIEHRTGVYYFGYRGPTFNRRSTYFKIIPLLGTTLYFFMNAHQQHAYIFLYFQKLFVPDGFKPTDAEKRGWLINPLGMEKSLPIWAIFLAFVPALLAFILLFMEEEITK